MTALAVTSQFVDFAKLSYFSTKAVTFVPSNLGAPGISGSGMRSAPRASIASSSVICAAFMVAVAVSSVLLLSSVSSASLVYSRSCVVCRVSSAARSRSYVLRVSLCLLTVLYSAFRLKIRLRAPFVVK